MITGRFPTRFALEYEVLRLDDVPVMLWVIAKCCGVPIITVRAILRKYGVYGQVIHPDALSPHYFTDGHYDH